ncbi:hypothetical protein [Streptomyces smyrnaeus]|uniref:hypothetical protein n=1 Tax=Streptomyces smyrnaeus TaxID=1387713 RepID=UPI0033DC1065
MNTNSSTTTPAVEALASLAAEHGVSVEEWDTATLDPQLREHFLGWHHRLGEKQYLIFPKGQDPAVRLAIAEGLLAHAAGEGAA